MNSESMLGGEVKNSSEMLTIIIPVVFGPEIPAEVARNTSGMLAIIPVEFQRNAGNHSGRIPAGIPGISPSSIVKWGFCNRLYIGSFLSGF